MLGASEEWPSKSCRLLLHKLLSCDIFFPLRWQCRTPTRQIFSADVHRSRTKAHAVSAIIRAQHELQHVQDVNNQPCPDAVSHLSNQSATWMMNLQCMVAIDRLELQAA